MKPSFDSENDQGHIEFENPDEVYDILSFGSLPTRALIRTVRALSVDNLHFPMTVEYNGNALRRAAEELQMSGTQPNVVDSPWHAERLREAAVLIRSVLPPVGQ